MILYYAPGQRSFRFIDACLSHLQVQVGNVEVIEWHIREHSDLTISESTGLLFQWDDSVPHNLFEMSTAVTSADECRFVGDSAYELGKVRKRLTF